MSDNQDPNEIRRKLRENLEKFKRSKGEESSDSSGSSNSSGQNSGSSSSNSGSSSNERKESRNDRDNSHSNSNSNSDNDDIISNITKSFKKFFSDDGDNGSSERKSSTRSSSPKLPFSPKVGGLVAALAVIVPYVLFGFYTVNEQDKGVVTRFGAYSSTSNPGLNWRAPFIESVKLVNVSRVNELRVDGEMLTRDENVVHVSMNVQYRITDPAKFLFNIVQPIHTLEEATESSLRYVIGHMDMDQILTTGRSEVRQSTDQQLRTLIDLYQAGITIEALNFQSARPPEEVKDAFDDAIKAQEDEERFKREAEAYKLSQEPIARGHAQQIIYQAEAYAKETLANAEGQAAEFNYLLPTYLQNPEIFKTRYYLDTMADIYGISPKVILEEGIQLNFLNLDNLLSSATPIDPGYPEPPIPYIPSRMAVPSGAMQYSMPLNSTQSSPTTAPSSSRGDYISNRTSNSRNSNTRTPTNTRSTPTNSGNGSSSGNRN